MNKYTALCGAMILLLGTGCSGVRNLKKPMTSIPEQYAIGVANDSTCLAEMEWWKFYSDTTLCRFIGRALENNRDILTAAARVDQMRELLGVDKANLLPSIGGNVYANRETNNYSGTGTTYDPEIGVKVPITWEMNLLGSLLWAKKKGQANYAASAEDYRAMQISIIARTAEAYYRLVALENELAIISHTVESRKESLRMAKIRFEGGLTSETVYQQAMVEYSSAASLVPGIKRRLTTARNALTLLMGENPCDSLTVGGKYLAPIQLEKMPVGVPSALLQRRPDVRAAELRLAAARANAGLTYAERFPTLQLGFTPGFENNELSKFLKSPFSFVVGSVSGPIFDFGKRKHRYKAAVAEYEQSRYQYEKSVITAFTEVNTAINAYMEAQRLSTLKINLCVAAAKYNQLARLQYQAGTLNYIDVLDAQRRFLDAQLDESNAIRDEYLALIDLYKVLGGGWTLN
ncbi:MAG: TolC family protein [Bacteroides sp.]|nr:TolC family protein [Bacteroides sp.]